MAGSKILVLGATGPTGINVLRELNYRKRATIVYVRNPSKIPEDLKLSPFIEVIKGEMDNLTLLSTAISQSCAIISLLGPTIQNLNIPPTIYADIYRSSVFPLMHEHGVRRILAMSTGSVSRPEDHWSFMVTVLKLVVRIFYNVAYSNVLAIADVFEREAASLDWTVYRIAYIPGGDDEASWQSDRNDGKTFVGWIGAPGWSIQQKRGALARWLVDAAEGGADEWIRKMPAVSRLAGSEKKVN
ncbi:hypothetical protein NA57DRAFT_62025 [Rhizodiscina lignyota]|uniref:NAD(P)-binding domain-containing protein n=1 Tax=Rhizodiscina lignyota TaxID=1504668 RepID=A0A9P4M0W9_9PEZI|nr:hypothetical protein NA57DRAFT_62025 [Rhizodiscina lignyota]